MHLRLFLSFFSPRLETSSKLYTPNPHILSPSYRLLITHQQNQFHRLLFSIKLVEVTATFFTSIISAIIVFIDLIYSALPSSFADENYFQTPRKFCWPFKLSLRVEYEERETDYPLGNPGPKASSRPC